MLSLALGLGAAMTHRSTPSAFAKLPSPPTPKQSRQRAAAPGALLRLKRFVSIPASQQAKARRSRLAELPIQLLR